MLAATNVAVAAMFPLIIRPRPMEATFDYSAARGRIVKGCLPLAICDLGNHATLSPSLWRARSAARCVKTDGKGRVAPQPQRVWYAQ